MTSGMTTSLSYLVRYTRGLRNPSQGGAGGNGHLAFLHAESSPFAGRLRSRPVQVLPASKSDIPSDSVVVPV